MKEITYGFSDSVFGKLIIGMSEQGICWLGFMTTKGEGAYKGDGLSRMKAYFPSANFTQKDDVIQNIVPIVFKAWDQDRLHELDLDIQGTDFQKSVWNILIKISKGQVKSYGDIASDIGKPKASRAVGTAVGNNPISLIIPCHRVIQKSGSMRNYGWGLPLKERILKSEKITFNGPKIRYQVNHA